MTDCLVITISYIYIHLINNLIHVSDLLQWIYHCSWVKHKQNDYTVFDDYDFYVCGMRALGFSFYIVYPLQKDTPHETVLV